MCAKLLQQAPSKGHTDELMQGFEEAFQGRSLAVLPDELVEAIDKSGSASLVLQVRQLKPDAVKEALTLAADAALLVVHLGVTRIEDAQRTLELVGPTKFIGAVTIESTRG